MFEDPEWDRRRVALLDAPEEVDLPPWDEQPAPVWDAADDAWIDQLAAADPDRPRTPAEVVADAERGPVSPQRIARLAAVDLTELDDDALVGAAVAWARVENYAVGAKLAAVAALAGPAPAHPDAPAAFVWAEVTAALHLGDGAGGHLVHVARELAARLPGTFAALRAGELSWTKADATVTLTSQLNAAQCAAVEARVLPKAAGRTPAQHRDAVRRIVDRLDPDAAARRREQAMKDIALVRSHLGGGMGELFARMTSEDLDVVWLAADGWARRTKAEGDPRTLDQLRVAALVRWAESFLTHGDPTRCDTTCATPAASARGAAADTPPRRHGRPVTVHLAVDLPTYLGLTDHPGELLGSGALIPAAALRDLIPDAAVRRIITDPLTGHLLDLGTTTARPSAALAAFCAARDITPTTPAGGTSPAAAHDLDHIHPAARGGGTDRDNLHSPTRRWHRAKTLAGWTVHSNPDHTWTWTSPTGRTYTTTPHDYRLGP